MRILLTGADGFTGKYFLNQAKILGYEIYPLKSNLLNQEALITEILTVKPTHVVHLAAITAVTHGDEKEFYQANLFGTLNLLNALTRLPYCLNKVLLASSANVYGNIDQSYIDETVQPNPENHYAMSKLAMEYMAKTYLDRLPLFFVRPFNYTGYGQDNRFLIPKIAEHFESKRYLIELGNLEVEREYNDVKAVCNIYIKLLEKAMVGEIYNVCSGMSYSLNNVLKVFAKIYGYEIEVRVNPQFVRQNEIKTLRGDKTKMEECIGKFEWPIIDSLLLEFYKKHRN